MRQIKRTFTHPSVFAGIEAGADWADPTMDPTEIDWEPRQDEAWIRFDVIDGRPINPCEDTGIDYGRGEFGHWGEKKMADALILAYKRMRRWRLLPRWVAAKRVLHMVVVERDDDHGWAIPGGGVEPGETAVRAAIREALEETMVDMQQATSRFPYSARYVPDPRASNEAWAVTTPVIFRMPKPVKVRGCDDARRAAWVRADSYAALEKDIRTRFSGKVFPAHKALLQQVLAEIH